MKVFLYYHNKPAKKNESV